MNEFFSVNDTAKILGSNIETVRRYIREGIMSDEDLAKAKDTAIKKGLPFEDRTAIDNNIDNLLAAKDRLALCVENKNVRAYNITKASLLVLLERKKKYNISNSIEAEEFIESRLAEKPAKNLSHRPHIFIIPASDLLPEIFKTTEDKEKFIKGLYLLQNIDNAITPSEEAFIASRASVLNVSEDIIKSWVPDPENLDKDSSLPQLKFDTRQKSVAFILELLRLAWQDRDCQDIEKKLVAEIAKLNNINEVSLIELQNKAELDYTRTIANDL